MHDLLIPLHFLNQTWIWIIERRSLKSPNLHSHLPFTSQRGAFLIGGHEIGMKGGWGRKRIESGTLKPGGRCAGVPDCMHACRGGGGGGRLNVRVCVWPDKPHMLDNLRRAFCLGQTVHDSCSCCFRVSQQADPDMPLPVMFSNLVENKHQFNFLWTINLQSRLICLVHMSRLCRGLKNWIGTTQAPPVCKVITTFFFLVFCDDKTWPWEWWRKR